MPPSWRRSIGSTCCSAGLAQARELLGVGPWADSFQGLSVSDDEVTRSLGQAPGYPRFPSVDALSQGPAWAEIAAGHPGWAWLRTAYAAVRS